MGDEGEHDQLPQSLGVLAHPIVLASLCGWLLNDHVLKDQFHNAVTGKLSDAFAMVVFPLLLAVVASRVTTRPFQWGAGITIAFYGSINLFDWADSLTESLLNLIAPSTLTKDPTDLALLPLLGVSAWVWKHRARTVSDMRRTAGRAVFAVGLLTCMATSVTEPTTASIDGTFVLDADTMEISMPLEFALDGTPASPYLDVDLDVFAFGPGTSAADPLPDDLVVWEANDESIAFTLTDTSWAPVEVSWSAVGVGVAGDACVFPLPGCEKDVIPTLVITQPPDVFGPEPDETFFMPDGQGNYGVVVAEARLVINEPDVRLRFADGSGSGRAATTNQLLERALNRPILLDLPEDCEPPCEISLWSSYLYNPDDQFDRYKPTGFEIYGDATVLEMETHRLELVASETVEIVLTKDDLPEGRDRVRRTFCAVLDSGSSGPTPIEEVTTLSYLVVSSERKPSGFDPTAPTIGNTNNGWVGAIGGDCVHDDYIWIDETDLDPSETVTAEFEVLRLPRSPSPTIEIVVRS